MQSRTPMLILILIHEYATDKVSCPFMLFDMEKMKRCIIILIINDRMVNSAFNLSHITTHVYFSPLRLCILSQHNLTILISEHAITVLNETEWM